MMLNMPSREIVVTALQVEVQPLALSMTYPADDHSPGRHLKQICNWLKIARVTRRSDLSKHAQFFSPDFAEIIREILLFELGEATTILTEGCYPLISVFRELDLHVIENPLAEFAA